MSTRWVVDLESATAAHPDGWVFEFTPAAPGVFDGECIAQPSPITPAHMASAARIAREAGDAYAAARRKGH